MKISVVSLGKLGFPVALAIESKGHEVYGTDINPAVKTYLETRTIPFREKDLQPLLDTTNLKLVGLEEAVLNADIVFTAPQTPHHPKYEGATRIPEDRKDFDYSYLVQVVTDIAKIAKDNKKTTTLVVISTCLPGTYEREIKPLLNEYIQYVYSPLYIAMGTVLQDYLKPEYSLIGTDDKDSVQTKELQDFYKTIHDSPHVVTDITTAEGVKVFYNTAITSKIILANSHMQVAHKMGMNVDDINKALMLSTDRIVSKAYMRSGGPDSGGCHPRDLIALSWVGDQIDLKPNWFELMAYTREKQTEWTADLVEKYSRESGLPIVILGKAFKPETNLTNGSGATLVANMLEEKGLIVDQYDPFIDDTPAPDHQAVYFIATEHRSFNDYPFAPNSVVIDLWRSIDEPKGCLYVPLGNPQGIKDDRNRV